MRIVLLTQHYYPEPCDIRGHVLAKELSARGHEVLVICGLPNYPLGRLYDGYRQRLWQRERVEGVEVLRLPIFPDHSLSVTRRAIHYLSFATSASLLAPVLSGPADVMWVYHPPLTVGIPAMWLKLLRRVPFVYEIQDLWPDTLIASGVAKEGLAVRILERLAKRVYRSASRVVVQSPGFLRALVARGVAREKLLVVNNWADEDIYRPVPKDPEIGAKYGLEGHFNVMFAGNMGPAQALDTVIECAKLLEHANEVQFVLIGDGVSVPTLQKAADAHRLKNVRFVARRPAEEMPRFFAWADALLLHLKDEPLFEITIPVKLMSYLACGRPIICALKGDGAEIVKSARAGLCCPPQDARAMADAILQLRNMSVKEREGLGTNGRNEYLAKYTKRVLVDTYERTLAEVAGLMDSDTTLHDEGLGGATGVSARKRVK